MSRALIPRDDNGFVRLDTPMTEAFLTDAKVVGDMPPSMLKQAAEAEYVRALGTVGWWEPWVNATAGAYVEGFSWYHRQFWNWLMTLDQTRPRPMIACWPRGAGKTTTVQLALLYMACTRLRGYGIYVGQTGKSSSEKVSAIGELLMSPTVARTYPDVARQYETATGAKRDWSTSRIRTASKFTLDAFGMDQAMRGAKVDEDRPGIIILDDIEDYSDSPAMTQKRIDVLTRTIVPIAAPNAIYIFIQNRIHDDSIMAQLIDGRADFLADREVVGPVKQINDIELEEYQLEDGRWAHRIVAGTPTWPHVLDIATSNQQLLDEGLQAFMAEKQHEEFEAEGDWFPRAKWVDADFVTAWGMRFKWLCRGWDLAATEKESSDWTVGALMGLDYEGVIWILNVARRKTTKVDDFIRETAEVDAEIFGSATKVHIAIEKQPSAAGVVWMESQAKMLTRLGFPVSHEPTSGSKQVRAQAFSQDQQRGWIQLADDPAPDADVDDVGHVDMWRRRFIRELAAFPKGAHDDQVDAASTAYNWLRGKERKRSRGRMGRATARATVG